MNMSIRSLETLEAAHIDPAQARAIVRVLETDSAARLETLVTKSDLLETRSELRDEMRQMDARFTASLGDLQESVIDRIQRAKDEGLRFAFLASLGQIVALVAIIQFFFGR